MTFTAFKWISRYLCFYVFMKSCLVTSSCISLTNNHMDIHVQFRIHSFTCIFTKTTNCTARPSGSWWTLVVLSVNLIDIINSKFYLKSSHYPNLRMRLPKLLHSIPRTLCYPTQVEISSPNLVFNSLKFYRHVDGMKVQTHVIPLSARHQ